MKNFMPFFLEYYDRMIIELIVAKYGYSYRQALKKFLNSETYNKLRNVKLEMWEFGYPAILEMWECEQITGSPLNSSYMRAN